MVLIPRKRIARVPLSFLGAHLFNLSAFPQVRISHVLKGNLLLTQIGEYYEKIST